MTLTTDIYWASRHPEVRKLRDMERMSAERAAAALELVKRGFTVDAVIDLGRWDAADTMRARQVFEFTWVPALGQQDVGVMPGLSVPAYGYDPDKPPPGSIRVSTDAADYPPFDPPAEAPPPVVLPAVGRPLGGPFFDSHDFTTPDGATLIQAGVTYRKHAKATPFGFYHYWEKVS